MEAEETSIKKGSLLGDFCFSILFAALFLIRLLLELWTCLNI